MIVLLFCYFLYTNSILSYLSGLGADSFLEIQSFDVVEAFGFLKTLKVVIVPNRFDFGYKAYLLLVVLFTVAMLIIKLYSLSTRTQTLLSLSLVAIPIVVLGIEMTSIMKDNTEAQAHMVENFVSDGPIEISRKQRELKLVVFIGESTSIMNLGIYGYFRNTTPKLQEISENDSRFLKFNNVFSTHVHTVESLLEALSISNVVGDEAIQPIENRKRLLLIDILNKAEIETHLVSNQPRSGSWNMAGPILFERATSAFYSVNERYAGNLEWRFPRPEESLFF
jgi:glucan phosphoethanolaminetransferase (alkaline phosphatase superfamily)